MSFHIGQEDLTEKQTSPGAAPNLEGATHKTHHSQKKVVGMHESHEKIYEINAGSETQSDTSSDQEQMLAVNATVQPLVDILKLDSFDSFVIDSQAGLTGKNIIA